MEQIDSFVDAFDLIDITQEEVLKNEKVLNWNKREDRFKFFQQLAHNLAKHATFYRAPGKRNKRNAVAMARFELRKLEAIYGKAVVEEAIKTL